ncbi:MAG: DUF4058 family protein [Planctomycetota bacterium]|nr:DUF4058 family protein [Planctomycetota bacterium]
MPSPFPGMDPYLEAYWGDVHTRLMSNASRQINLELPDDLQARVEEGLRVVDDGAWEGTVYPDVLIVETPDEDVASPPRDTAVQVAEPCVLILDDRPVSRHIEIIDLRDDGRVVTAIEFLSRSNKVGQAGIQVYRKKQRAYLDAGVNLVEIDLLRDGDFVLAAPEEAIPLKYRTPYRICVRRARDLQRIELYRAPLRERLPNIPIPLRSNDPDVILQLQPLLDECYRDGKFRRLNYQQEPSPRLEKEDAAWADRLLQDAGLRLMR